MFESLHTSKTCGPVDLSAEHLVHAHLSLCVHLKVLFNAIFSHGNVPNGFGQGIIVPLIKDKTGNLHNIANYRPVTLVPVISHLFVSIITYLSRLFYH